MPSPTDSTWPTSETSASWPKFCDLLLEDRGNFRGADIHQPTSFIACLSRIEFGAKRTIDHAAAEFDDKAADDRGIDFDVDPNVFSRHRFQRVLRGRRDTCRTAVRPPSPRRSPRPCDAPPARGRRGSRRATANSRRLAATTSEKLRGDAADTGLVEHRGQRLRLESAGKHRAAHQTLQIGAVRQQSVKFVAGRRVTASMAFDSRANSNKAVA